MTAFHWVISTSWKSRIFSRIWLILRINAIVQFSKISKTFRPFCWSWCILSSSILKRQSSGCWYPTRKFVFRGLCYIFQPSLEGLVRNKWRLYLRTKITDHLSIKWWVIHFFLSCKIVSLKGTISSFKKWFIVSFRISSSMILRIGFWVWSSFSLPRRSLSMRFSLKRLLYHLMRSVLRILSQQPISITITTYISR